MLTNGDGQVKLFIGEYLNKETINKYSATLPDFQDYVHTINFEYHVYQIDNIVRLKICLINIYSCSKFQVTFIKDLLKEYFGEINSNIFFVLMPLNLKKEIFKSK